MKYPAKPMPHAARKLMVRAATAAFALSLFSVPATAVPAADGRPVGTYPAADREPSKTPLTGAKLTIPDAGMMDLYKQALQIVLRSPAASGREDPVWDNARQAVSLAQAGYPKLAMERLSRTAADLRAGAASAGTVLLPASTIWAAAEVGAISGNPPWLAEFYPMMKACASEAAGILKRAASDGGVGGTAGGEWEFVRTIQSAAETARAMARFEDAENLERDLAACRSLVLDRAWRSVNSGHPVSGTDIIGEGLEAVFPSALIDPQDRLISGSLGQPAVRTGAAAPEGPASLLLLANAHIVRGEQAEALTCFKTFVSGADIRTRPAGIGDADGLRPALALLVTTMRNMIIREDGRNLHFLSAVPAAWLRPGTTLSAENFPTRFGLVSLIIECRERDMTVYFSRPARSDPERILIHLPEGLEITGVGRCGNTMRMWGLREVYLAGFMLNEVTELKINIKRRSL